MPKKNSEKQLFRELFSSIFQSFWYLFRQLPFSYIDVWKSSERMKQAGWEDVG